MGDLALVAARECLKWAMTGLVTSDIPELEHIPATAFHDLLRYHEECRVVAPKVAAWTSVKSWDSRIESCIWFMCSLCTVGSYALGAGCTGKYARDWWCKYLQSVASSLAISPTGMVTSDLVIQQQCVQRASTCSVCAAGCLLHLASFAALFADSIDLETSRVSLFILHGS
ncbi:unnamed protein product [Somion occarium]|uniref:Uncharacterized protein n=1 Tax=Somion occarium TaxID=3059160 RepID=A0ABP1DJB9_9APHY